MCLSSCCHRITLKGHHPWETSSIYLCMYRGQERIIRPQNKRISRSTFILCGWMTFPFIPLHIRPFTGDEFVHFLLGEVNWKICVKTLRWLWRLLKSAPGLLLLAVRRYGYHGKPVVFLPFWGTGEGGGIYSIPSLQVENPQVFKPWIKLKLSTSSGSIIHHSSRWRYIIPHKL